MEAEGAASTSVGAPQALLGARVQQVTAALAQRLGLPAGTTGLLLADVTPGGPAWEAGLVEPGAARWTSSGRWKAATWRPRPSSTAALRRAGPNSIVSLDVVRVLGDGSSNPYIRRLRLAEAPR